MTESERTTTNEIEVSAQAGLPEWLGLKASTGVRWKRQSTTRVREFGEQVANAAELSPDVIAERLDAGGPLLDTYMEAAGRVAGVHDEVYRAVLAKAVAAMFDVGAEVDEVGLICAELQRLEPVHVRVFGAFLVRPQPGPEQIRVRRPAVDVFATDELCERAGVGAVAGESACSRLVAAGFLSPQSAREPAAHLDPPQEVMDRRWAPTDLGRTVLRLIVGVEPGPSSTAPWQDPGPSA